MTPKITGRDELHLAENPAVAELLQSLGYTCVLSEGGVVLAAWRFGYAQQFAVFCPVRMTGSEMLHA